MDVPGAVGTAGLGLVLTSVGLGLRHGIDWDHIAAITDVASTSESRRESLRLSTLYAVGHAIVVLALGVLAIQAAAFLPAGFDAAMERVVGATLLLLGGWVVVGLLRHGRDFRLRSRWMLLLDWLTAARRRLTHPAELVAIEHDHEHSVTEVHADQHAHVHAPAMVGADRTTTHRHPHRHLAPAPRDPFAAPGGRAAFTIGMLHGVGAETPTQVALFVAAAGVGGTGVGLLLLGGFVLGLLVSNSAIALVAAQGLLDARRHFGVHVAVSLGVAVLSLVLGGLLLAGHGDVFPALLG